MQPPPEWSILFNRLFIGDFLKKAPCKKGAKTAHWLSCHHDKICFN